MIDKVQVGTKIIISNRCNYWQELRGKVFEITKFTDDGDFFELYSFNVNNPKEKFNACGVNKKDFDYYGNHVNNEVIELVSKYDIKSFQAVLDDGRIINYSCLN